MKLILIKYMVFFLFTYSLGTSANIIGYGSSDAVLPAKNQELFYMGFKKGFESKIKDKSILKKVAVKQVSNGSPLGAIAAVSELLKDKVQVIVGFPTSHEAVLAAQKLKNREILFLASGAGHSSLSKLGGNIYTTGESMDYSVQTMIEFMGKKFGKKRGALVVNPYTVFSKNQEKTFYQKKNLLEKHQIELLTIKLTKKLKISLEDIKKMKKVDFLCFTPYADESVQVMEQLDKYKIDKPIVTNSSWTTGDVEFIRRFLANRKENVYSAALWIKGMKDSLKFEKMIRTSYGREATAENSYGFDLGIILARTLNRITSDFSSKNILKAFKRIKCFEGLSSGKLCFGENGGHAKRSIHFVKFTKKGFKIIE